ncbi:uncharacterized protein F5147DRAFT_649848 [Suillus discolor]|uniref:Uncharacterized protein n=1 Tax=Suillus discolor TaxID=1912936 RepID=A0A9P7JX90_9AGAM|nr:uncharacterized protein F5147DRAFT_649848 [Suillus discolor]KAG2114685.1 hypothetical protein F5147DRAFT_649848 [Suillus discolor]
MSEKCSMYCIGVGGNYGRVCLHCIGVLNIVKLVRELVRSWSSQLWGSLNIWRREKDKQEVNIPLKLVVIDTQVVRLSAWTVQYALRGPFYVNCERKIIDLYCNKNGCLECEKVQANTITPVLPPSWHHLIGKRPVVTCTNIIGFLPIPDVYSESLADKPISGNDAPLLALILAVPIKNSMVGILAEALMALQSQPTTFPGKPRSRHKISEPSIEYFNDDQHRENKVNVQDLFKETFHFVKDDEYMLYKGAAREAILLFVGSMGPGVCEE